MLPVLVEGESRQGGGQLFGRTTWNRIVNFAGEAELVGRIVAGADHPLVQELRS